MAVPLSMQTKLLFLLLSVCLATNIVYADIQNVRFDAITYPKWKQKLASYPPDIVVVDMWATWCASCIERFPRMIELYERYHNMGVRFVSLCLDDHEDKPALTRAEKFLNSQQAHFKNYWMDENMMQAFDQLNLIGIPAVVIYDHTGREAYRLTGDNPNNQFTDRDIERAIKSLLLKRKPNK